MKQRRQSEQTHKPIASSVISPRFRRNDPEEIAERLLITEDVLSHWTEVYAVECQQIIMGVCCYPDIDRAGHEAHLAEYQARHAFCLALWQQNLPILAGLAAHPIPKEYWIAWNMLRNQQEPQAKDYRIAQDQTFNVLRDMFPFVDDHDLLPPLQFHGGTR